MRLICILIDAILTHSRTDLNKGITLVSQPHSRPHMRPPSAPCAAQHIRRTARPACAAIAIAYALLSPAARAQDMDGAAWVERLGQLTVSATRSPKTVLDVPVTVSVIDSREIEDTLIGDIKDLVRFEPGVSVRSSPARFTAAAASTGRDGNAGFNIRGLEGNRVMIQTDGIRMPEAFGFGAQSVGRGDYADLDLIKSVEILRGPASTLYGSDGLAGAVSFLTKDPDDILRPGETFGGRARLGYTGADDGWAKSLMLAGRAGDVSLMVAYTRRDSEEQDNKGTNREANARRTAPNPQVTDSNAVLAKAVWAPGNGHRLRLTYDFQDRKTDTHVLSAIAVPPLTSTSLLDVTAFDKLRRERFSLDHSYEGDGTLRRASWAVYHQKSRTRQFTAEDRNTAADRTRDNSFDNRIIGANAMAELGFSTGSLDHAVQVGADVSQTRQSGVRDGTVPPVGETFPSRAFPLTDFTLAGLFVQDEISLADGRVTLYPSVRIDHYKLKPKADALFHGAFATKSGEAVSPKFGAVWWLQPHLGLFANYASGFRAPSPSEVNNGFSNPLMNYASRPNPDLEPETSDTLEGGLRLREVDVGEARVSASLTAFIGWYKDFIQQALVGGSFTAQDPAVYQFVNMESVRIHGLEFKADASLGSGFHLNLAASYTKGRQTDETGVRTPLSSIDPVKVVGGLSYREPESGRYGGQFFLTWSAKKKQGRIAETCSPACFTPPAFVIADATAYFNVTRAATVRVGVFNIFDKKYWWWSDVRGLAATSTTADAFTQPGRTVNASLVVKF